MKCTDRSNDNCQRLEVADQSVTSNIPAKTRFTRVGLGRCGFGLGFVTGRLKQFCS